MHSVGPLVCAGLTKHVEYYVLISCVHMEQILIKVSDCSIQFYILHRYSIETAYPSIVQLYILYTYSIVQ